MVGVLSGGVTIASVAGSITHIGPCILIGGVAGLLSGFYLQVLHPRLNKKRSVDHLGIFGPILICSVLGGALVSPVTYKAFMSLGINTSTLGNQITDSNLMAYQLIYIGISALAGSGSGLLAALISYRIRDSDSDFDVDKLVSSDYGIFRADDPV